ncbi:MAG: oxygenase MpaB family protein [Chloroflexota bacterium]
MHVEADTQAVAAAMTPVVREGRDSDGLYGPTSEAWAMNREGLLLLGSGPRALLLQIAHPLVAEGVDQHSDFRDDPWARLAATIASYQRIVYGTAAQARAEIRRLNTLHRSIAGPVRDADARRRHGAAYSARDPELSLWVHATLIDSVLVASDAWIGPVTRDRRVRFYEESKPIGRAFGVPESLLPADVDAFERYMAAMLGPGGPVSPTPTARGLAETILHPPLGPIVRSPAVAGLLRDATPLVERGLALLPPPLYDWTMLPAVGLLPQRLREAYGLRWGAREKAIAGWLVAAWRVWRPILPPAVRWFPQAISAERRVAAGGSRRRGSD